MLFNSYIFIFLFLPAVLAGWYGLNRVKLYRTACLFLSGMSLWFYAYFNLKYLLLILGSVVMNYGISALIAAWEKHPHSEAQSAPAADPGRDALSGARAMRLFHFLGVTANLALFFYFKYFDFFIENVNALFRTDWPLRHILLPLGISFFTFQQLSFIIDRTLGRAEHYPFIEYLTFVTFFPQLIAGPIVLYDEMMPQFADPAKRRFDSDSFARGIVLFIIGLSKKVLIADSLAAPADFGFANPWHMDTVTGLLVLASYSMQLYFDFSGYSDMACGLAKMFNITLPVNFDSPFRAESFHGLWRRWHMTLTRFFTRYVYIPLGGSRCGEARHLANIMIVFTLSGLWHGAAWTFVVWGALTGLIIIAEDKAGALLSRIRGSAGKTPPASRDSHAGQSRLPRLFGRARAALFFMLTFLFFRAESLSDAWLFFKNLFVFRLPGFVFLTARTVAPAEFYVLTKAVSLKAPQYSDALSLVLWISLLFIAGIALYCPKNARAIAEIALVPETGSSAGASPAAPERKASDGGVRLFTRRRLVLSALLFLWCVLSLSSVSRFLYFNF